MPVFPLDEPYRPAPKTNNVWYQDRKTDQAIVFVHGVLSDSQGCWYCEPSAPHPGVYWPDLIARDPRFSAYSIYLGGYFTDVTSGPYEVSDCAEELFRALDRPGDDGGTAVLDHKTIIFVCHSMGGIVVRYMLTARPWRFQDRKIGLALIASPSYGSAWADRLDLLLKYFKNEQGKTLVWGNWSLRDLDDRFRLMLQEKAIPRLTGQEACENHFVLRAKWLRPAEAVVSKESAGRYFGRVVMLPDTDHFTCVKPGDRNHPAYQFLNDFCHEVEEAAGQVVSAAAIPSHASACRGMYWDVAIDEEGDGYNEMTYQGIVLPPEAPLILPLPPGELQAGHSTPYELLRDGRTSEGITLVQSAEEAGARRIETKVVFENRPTAAHPAGFCLSNYDWNAYAMNMEEYRQKPGWREDGMDYVEKAIPESWDVFSLLIRYPNEMAFAKEPFFEVYDYSKGKDERRDDLTASLQDSFRFSRAQKTAVLLIRQPEAALSYRISWLLGESGTAVTSPLVPKQRQRQRLFASQMLEMRRGGETGAPAVRTAVNSVLASVAGFIEQILDQPLDPGALELSLMVLDEEQMEEPSPGARKLPVLRVVAGTLVRDPNYTRPTLFVGDGNAGRAWKRRMARVFDPAGKDPKRHIYVTVAQNQRHQFLISVPLIDPESAALIYGILNIGTFSAAQAELMRPLGNTDKIEGLTGYTQAFVLKRLLESLKL